jgi:hypothetical protein
VSVSGSRRRLRRAAGEQWQLLDAGPPPTVALIDSLLSIPGDALGLTLNKISPNDYAAISAAGGGVETSLVEDQVALAGWRPCWVRLVSRDYDTF